MSRHFDAGLFSLQYNERPYIHSTLEDRRSILYGFAEP